MSVLYIGLLVFAYVGASSGDETCKGSSEVPVFGALGGHVLLQLEESERRLCPWKCQLQVKKNSSYSVTKTEIPTNKTSAQCTNMKPNCQVFNNGSLQLSHVTPDVSGTYSLTLESNGACKYEKYFRVHIQDPVSVPQVSYTCQRNYSVHLSCLAESGTDPTYSWHVDGTPRWTLTKEILTDYKSVLRQVTCTVKNKVSEKWSQPTDITCPGAGASLGSGVCPASEVPVFGALGGHVMLQIEESERGLCPGECRLYVTKNSRSPVTKTEIPTSETSAQCTVMRPGCQVFTNGSLQLSHLTPEVSGTYSLSLGSNGECKFQKYFRVHVQDPVSVPQMNYTCQRNSSVHLSCFAENGTDLSYSWHVDGTPRWTLTKEMLTEYESVLRHVTCTVKNNVSEERSRPIDVTCEDTGDTIFVLRLVSAVIVLVALGLLIRWHLA